MLQFMWQPDLLSVALCVSEMLKFVLADRCLSVVACVALCFDW